MSFILSVESASCYLNDKLVSLDSTIEALKNVEIHTMKNGKHYKELKKAVKNAEVGKGFVNIPRVCDDGRNGVLALLVDTPEELQNKLSKLLSKYEEDRESIKKQIDSIESTLNSINGMCETLRAEIEKLPIESAEVANIYIKSFLKDKVKGGYITSSPF